MSIDDLIVIPSKKVIELITVEYDLLEQLPSGITITEVVVDSLVFQGFPDIAASSMLYLPPVINGSLVQQKVRNGIPGNTYNITFIFTLSNGWVLIKTFRLSITPNNTPAVPISIPLYFTSRPYPYNYYENLIGDTSMLSGGFLFSPRPLEDLAGNVSMLFGSLSNGLTSYTYSFEDLTGIAAMMSGTLVSGLQTYNYVFEDLTGSATMRNGTLAVVLITYNYPFEDLAGTVTMRSGTLV